MFLSREKELKNANYNISFLNTFYFLCYYSCPNISPFAPVHPAILSPLSSCPWIMHISSSATPFPILFLTSPCLFCTYQSVLLNRCTFAFSPFLFPTDNPPNDLHIYDSICSACLFSLFFRFNC